MYMLHVPLKCTLITIGYYESKTHENVGCKCAGTQEKIYIFGNKMTAHLPNRVYNSTIPGSVLWTCLPQKTNYVGIVVIPVPRPSKGVETKTSTSEPF